MNIDPIQRTFRPHVGKKKCLGELLAFERNIQGMPYPTVGPITTYKPFRFQMLLAPIGATDNGADAILSLGEADQFSFAFHMNPILYQLFKKNLLGLALRQTNREPITAW